MFLTFIQEGRADCLANEEGDRQISSTLAFHGDEEVIYWRKQEKVMEMKKLKRIG